jgi:hypothetical protein
MAVQQDGKRQTTEDSHQEKQDREHHGIAHIDLETRLREKVGIDRADGTAQSHVRLGAFPV